MEALTYTLYLIQVAPKSGGDTDFVLCVVYRTDPTQDFM